MHARVAYRYSTEGAEADESFGIGFSPNDAEIANEDGGGGTGTDVTGEQGIDESYIAVGEEGAAAGTSAAARWL